MPASTINHYTNKTRVDSCLFVDGDGVYYVTPSGGGPPCIQVKADSRATRTGRVLATLLRQPRERLAMVRRIAKRLEGEEGWFATHAVDLRFGRTA